MADWITKPGNTLDLDISVSWQTLAGDQIDIDFSPEVPCPQEWAYIDPLNLDIRFKRDWETKDPLNLDFTFECVPDAEPLPNLFTGFFDFGASEEAEATLLETFMVTTRDGATFEFAINDFSGTMPMEYRTGETFQFAINDFTGTLPMDFYTGEMLGNDFLTTYPSLNMLPDAYTGERVEWEMSATYNLPLNFYVGEYATVTLALEQQLGDTFAQDGSYALATLDTRPAAELTALAYTGETGEFNLKTSVVFTLDHYAGEVSLVDLNVYPAPELLALGYAGETGQIAIAFAQALGTFNAYTGERGDIEDLDEVELWRFIEGATAVADLSTQTTFPQNHYTGELVTVDLNIRPSEGMGTFRAYAGESGVLDLKTLVAVYLYPNRISTRTEIFCDFDSSTKFDLLDTTCCPVKESHEIIELLHGPAPDEHYDGDKTIAVMDLSTRPRFQFNFSHGESSTVVNPVFLGFLLMSDGQEVGVDYIDLEITDFKLCPGNFIPDPEFTFIELATVYDEACEADFVFVGETMKVQLQNNIDPGASLQQHGEYMTIDFETPWLLLAYTGEHARVSNPEFTMLAFAGEAIPGFNMYDEPYQAGTGEFATITGLTTEYFAEFLEVGCLDNEFVPSNENGDPDMENFNPVPTEGEEFSHSILARCF